MQTHPCLLGWFGVLTGLCFPFVTPTLAISAPFQNLDFEMAIVPALPPGEFGGHVPIEDALPGWNAY